MVVKVHIWTFEGKFSGENWGHSSMELSDGTYISWWPETAVGTKGKALIPFEWVDAHQNRTLQDDITAEGKDPDDTIEFDDDILDETKIKEWWEKFKGGNRYNGVLNNCSTIVYYALKFGGALKYVLDPINLVWDPNDVQRFAKEVVQNYKSKSSVPSKVTFPKLSSELEKMAKRASQLGSVSFVS